MEYINKYNWRDVDEDSEDKKKISMNILEEKVSEERDV